ncbi:hypothetical protein [Luteolibacter luteus]|uniref:Chalcone isomerase domain-containing protein n=1 Tax=Luteolibacter luteus TaxID=2728835 RepID=A0A858RF09_9BACT|nr:hypothetical protein [Luteolibacter luteus]QJE95427.1 hypothetical protein HHL09_06405 [Luteolibacter luteus]
MNRRQAIFWISLLGVGVASAQTDPGKDVIGTVTVVVYYGTNGEASAAGPRAKEIASDTSARLSKDERLRFSKYRELGRDMMPLYRTYENWAKPLAPSNEVLLRFEAQSHLSTELMRMDVELWIAQKKILKTDAAMTPDKPLLVLGPEWRGGRLIISVELKPGKPKSKDEK